MLPEILGDVQCVISGQIIEIVIENPTVKGRKGNLLLDICLREITVWLKRTMWVTFISPSAGKCFAYDRQLKRKRDLFFLFVVLAENENILFAYCQKISCLPPPPQKKPQIGFGRKRRKLQSVLLKKRCLELPKCIIIYLYNDSLAGA